MKYFDIIIVGGGPAGTTTALTLSQYGHKVLLYDDIHKSKYHIGQTLLPVARQLLQKLGVLESFLNGPHIPNYGNLFAWGSQNLENTDFILNPHGHGWHVDRDNFDAILKNIAHDAGTNICNDKVNAVIIVSSTDMELVSGISD